MPGWLDRVGAALLDSSLAAAAISGLAFLAMLQCRQPARRIGWARAGLLSTLLLLPLAALNPVPRIDIQPPLRSLFSVEPSSPAISIAGKANLEQLQEAEHVLGQDRTPDRPTLFRRICRLVVGLYLIGLGLGFCWIGIGVWGTSRLVGRARTPSRSAQMLYETLPISARKVRPRLLVLPSATRPVLVGWIRPVILIPEELDEELLFDGLRLSLLHELAHFENRDHQFGPAVLVAQAFWFFLPTFWWMRDLLKLDQEFIADRLAVSRFGETGQYASSLVELAAPPGSGNLPWTGGHPAPSIGKSPVAASSLVQRVQMLLKCPFTIEQATPLWWRWSTALTLSLATLAVSCLSLRGLDSWSETEPKTTHGAGIPEPLRLARLDLTPSATPATFSLPYRLPDHFTLTLEILAEPAELPLLEILGHRLAPSTAINTHSSSGRIWHRVAIRRLRGVETIQIDGQALASPGHQPPLASWLTIRPIAVRSTRIRNLALD